MQSSPRFRAFLVGTEFYRAQGGIQRVNQLLLRCLSEFAVRTPSEIEVFSYNDRQDARGPALHRPDGIAWHACDRRRIALVGSLAWRLQRVRPHLVLLAHVNLAGAVWLVRLLSPQTRVAILGHGREMWVRLPHVLRRAVREADALVAPSAYTRRKLIRRNGADPERVSVIAHGLSPEWEHEVAPAAPTRPGKTLLSVTRLTRQDTDKGVDTVLQALPRILARCPEACYVVVGSGADRRRLKRLARQLGVRSKVEFRGELSDADLAKAYEEADLFVLPSKQEGFGIVFLEAMYRFLPVVAARAGGSVDVVVDGVTGRLVPPDDVARLASAVSELLLGDAQRREMGQAARRHVEENFLFRHFAARWQRWLADLAPEAVYLARHTAALAVELTAQGQHATPLLVTRAGCKTTRRLLKRPRLAR